MQINRWQKKTVYVNSIFIKMHETFYENVHYHSTIVNCVRQLSVKIDSDSSSVNRRMQKKLLL